MSARAAIISVPADQPTVAAALAAAGPGDEIVIAPGEYRETLTMPDRDLILRSTDPGDPGVVRATILKGDGVWPTLSLSAQQTSATLIQGLTITGGNSGIVGNKSKATISQCYIWRNAALNWGGGIQWSDGLIVDNEISENSAGTQGGGLYGCYGEVRGNWIHHNHYECFDTRCLRNGFSGGRYYLQGVEYLIAATWSEI